MVLQSGINFRCNNLYRALDLEPALGNYMRRGADLETYYQGRGWRDERHLREADINQEIYGLPEWLPALRSALLNESATLFRRKYYNNGSHVGFIMYMTDTAENEADVAALRSALKSAKGGQLSQPVHVCTKWQEGWHPVDTGR